MRNSRTEPGWPAADDYFLFGLVVHRNPLDRTTVMQVSGELDAAVVGRLEEALRAAVRRPGERLMVDLCDCVSIDSMAIGSLFRARRAFDCDSATGPPMVLVANRPHIAFMLEMSGLDRLVATLRDRHEALDLPLRLR